MLLSTSKLSFHHERRGALRHACGHFMWMALAVPAQLLSIDEFSCAYKLAWMNSLVRTSLKPQAWSSRRRCKASHDNSNFCKASRAT